jgi:hypothetical protein
LRLTLDGGNGSRNSVIAVVHHAQAACERIYRPRKFVVNAPISGS